jgi:hypothetical protein
MDERQRIEQAIAAQESHRATVGDAIIDETIAALRKKLAHLEKPEQQRKLVTIPPFATLSSSDTATIKLSLQGDSSDTLSASLTTYAARSTFLPMVEK